MEKYFFLLLVIGSCTGLGKSNMVNPDINNQGENSNSYMQLDSLPNLSIDSLSKLLNIKSQYEELRNFADKNFPDLDSRYKFLCSWVDFHKDKITVYHILPAVMIGYEELCKVLIGCFPHILNEYLELKNGQKTFKTTLLHQIIKDRVVPNRLIIIEMLLEAGADLNLQDGDGNIPLCYLIEIEDIDTTKFLLKNWKCCKFHSCLIKGIVKSNKESIIDIFKLLCKKFDNEDKLKALWFILNSDNFSSYDNQYKINNRNEMALSILNEEGLDSCSLSKKNPDYHNYSALEMAEEAEMKPVANRLKELGVRLDPFYGLCLASKEGNLEVVKKLLAGVSSAEVNEKSKDGHTPLHLAAANGHPEVVKILLAGGANINEKDDSGHTPLHLAAANGHPEVVKILLAGGANINEKDDSGHTPLHLAAANGYAKVVKKLLDSGANINEKDALCGTPLYVAAANGYAEVVQLLLASGANINERGDIHEISLSYFILKQESDEKVVHLGYTALHVATTNNHPKVVEILANHANLNEKDEHGDTALHTATKKGYTNIVEILAKSVNVNVNEKDEDGDTALHIATTTGNTNIVTLLLANCANADEQNKDGDTALHLATKDGNTNIATLLLAKRANADEKDKHGDTAYANVNKKYKNGDTALHLATVHSFREIVSLLLNKGAKLDVQNNVGDTPLHTAIDKVDTEVLQEIVDHVLESGKIDVFVMKNHDDLNPLDLLCKKIGSAGGVQHAYYKEIVSKMKLLVVNDSSKLLNHQLVRNNALAYTEYLHNVCEIENGIEECEEAYFKRSSKKIDVR